MLQTPGGEGESLKEICSYFKSLQSYKIPFKLTENLKLLYF